jgi:hypothetical protein
LNFSLPYHLQTDGQTERTNQILEDMLGTYALKYGKSWDESLPYVEFSYNNSYQASLKMSPFEALYGRPCRTPLFWNEIGETQVFRPDVLKMRRSRFKSFVTISRLHNHDNRAMLIRGEGISHSKVAYQLELPPQLAEVHDVFHVSQLKKCLRVPEELLPIEEL